MSFHSTVVLESWLMDNSMLNENYPVLGLELDIDDEEKMSLFSSSAVMLSFVVKTARRSIKLYQYTENTFKEIFLKKELVMVRFLRNKATVHPLDSEILNFKPIAQSAVGRIAIETSKHLSCHDLIHYLSIICTSNCRSRSKLSEKSTSG